MSLHPELRPDEAAGFVYAFSGAYILQPMKKCCLHRLQRQEKYLHIFLKQTIQHLAYCTFPLTRLVKRKFADIHSL